MHVSSTTLCLVAATGLMTSATAAPLTKSGISQLQMRNDFMKAMKSVTPSSSNFKSAKAKRDARRELLSQKEMENQTPSLESVADAMKGTSMNANWLRKKILSKAKFVSPEEVRAREQAEAEAKQQGERKLQNGNNYGYNAANGANANGGYDADFDGTDDWFVANGEWENVFGFDVTEYSMSYLRCAAVRQFDDELAAQEDTTSVFATKQFAIFRFCPARLCDGVQQDDEEERNRRGLRNLANNGNANYNYAMYGANYQENREEALYGAMCQPDENGYLPEGCGGEPIHGAGGEGCQSNYGEYMVELDDYLQIMQEYRQERFEAYCEYCEECAMKVYQKWMQWSKNQDYSNRKLTDHAFEDKEAWQRDLETMARDLGNFDPTNICTEYNACKIYDDVCGHDIDGGYAEYFECTEVERNNGQVAYIGPHCAADGVTVTLGLYSDEYCNEYIGNGVDIRNFLGEEVDEMEMADYVTGSLESVIEFYNPGEQLCIPCRAGDQMYEAEGSQYHDDGNYGDDEVNELCENLYLTSARCDRHYRSYSTKTKNAKYYDKNLMELSCDFIDSVVEGNFDEQGFVILDNSNVNNSTNPLKNNLYYEEYGHYIEEVTPFQIFGLIASILAMLVLGLWAAALHKSLTKNGTAWRPRRGINGANAGVKDPVDVSRQNSGIVMGRSRSNMSYYAN